MFLHIQSYGGCVFSGFSSVDYIKRTKAPIHSIVEGCVALAATLMSVVADKRLMTEHSFMLIHQLSGVFGAPTKISWITRKIVIDL